MLVDRMVGSFTVLGNRKKDEQTIITTLVGLDFSILFGMLSFIIYIFIKPKLDGCRHSWIHW